jgi:hypothetical protein
VGSSAGDGRPSVRRCTAGADRFVTTNRKDFPVTIAEIDITHPGALGDG